MRIFGFNLNKSSKEVVGEVIIPQSSGYDMSGISLSAQTDLPSIKENRNNEWVNYGNDNLYPEYLKDMYNSSPTHNAIVKTKAQMVVGDGWSFDDTMLNEKEKIDILQILNQIDDDFYELSLDFQIFGAMALEVIWSLDHSRVVEVNRIDVSKLRSGKFEDGKICEWFYKRDWSDRREEVVEIHPFDRGDLEHHRQILYIPGQKVSNEYYGEPSYLGAIDWIALESGTGVYYKSLLDNSFNPSLLVKFYRRPGSQEEKDSIVSGLKSTFGGIKKAGKAMIMFSDGKELAPDVTPVDVQNVDKQFTVISDQITQKILTGERATTPELFGLTVPSALGNGDFETKVKCFTKFVIRPDQIVFEKMVNSILITNGYRVNFKLNPLSI
jgi:hypothetical protein